MKATNYKHTIIITTILLLLSTLSFSQNKFESKLNEKWNNGRNEREVNNEFLPDFDLLRKEGKTEFVWKHTIKASELKNHKPIDVHIIDFTRGDEKHLNKFIKKAKKYSNIEAIRIGAIELNGPLFESLIDALSDKKHFKKLIISVCKTKNIPSNINQLNHLETFNLANNHLVSIPKELCEIKTIRYLNFRGNSNLSQLPENFGNLINLEYLNFSGSGLVNLPQNIGECSSLTKIVGNAAKVKAIPESIGNCKFLRDINLAYNDISIVPESLGDLSGLLSLSLGGNNISQLPESFGNLKNLTFCGLALNKFDTFPVQVLGLDRVGSLWLHGNSFDEIPMEVAEMKSLANLLISFPYFKESNIEALKAANPEIQIVNES